MNQRTDRTGDFSVELRDRFMIRTISGNETRGWRPA